MTLIAATYEDIPEVMLGDAIDIQDHYRRLHAGTGLAGFILRGIGTDADAVHDTLQQAVEGVIDLGERHDQIHFPEDNFGVELGYHIDTDKVDEVATVGPRVNENTVQKGKLEVDLFNLREPYATQNRRGPSVLSIILFDDIAYARDRLVDNEFVDPKGYRGELETGDCLVFLDACASHDFRELQSPRNSTASLYRIHLLR